jgi:hypothetical protein
MELIEIKTFSELEHFLQKWGSGSLKDNVVLYGKGGLGKSRSIANVNALRFDGHITPFRAFQLGYENPEANIIWDDMDDILRNKQMVKLLKQFCELETPKMIHFATTKESTAQEKYEFTGHSLVILNEISNKIGKNLKALLTRFIVVNFNPTKEEVLNKLKQYAENNEVVEEIERLMPKIKDFNFRVYEHLNRMSEAGMDWKSYLYKSISPRLFEVYRLQAEYNTHQERIHNFNGGRTQYYYWNRLLGN